MLATPRCRARARRFAAILVPPYALRSLATGCDELHKWPRTRERVSGGEGIITLPDTWPMDRPAGRRGRQGLRFDRPADVRGRRAPTVERAACWRRRDGVESARLSGWLP